MLLFIDTANIDEIREISQWGILAGVTTNPTLLAKESLPFEDALKEITELVDGLISAEVVATECKDMVSQGIALSMLHPNIIIKVPMTDEGLKAIKSLTEKGIKTNCTLVFSANQALLAARAGAYVVSPFVGRVDDIGNQGSKLIEEISTIFTLHDIKTKIIAASIRTPQNVTDAALAGADIATIPYAVLKKMLKHPLTDIGIDKFTADWEKVKK